MTRLQSATEALDVGKSHHHYEHRAKAGHDVKGVVQQLDVRGPCFRRKRIQSSDLAVEVSVGKEAEHPWNLDRVVDTTLLDVRLSDQRDFRHRSGFEAALHRGKHRFLIARNDLGLQVPGRKRHEDCRGKAGDGSVFQVQPPLISMRLAQRIERADGGDCESARYQRGPWLCVNSTSAQGLSR